MAVHRYIAVLVLMALAILAQYHAEEDHYAHPKFEFKYGVKDEHTHDVKEQAEKRDGHKVEGHYMLVESDSTIRTIHYNADKHTGFNANVHRTGHAKHPVNYQKIIEYQHNTDDVHTLTASSYINSQLH